MAWFRSRPPGASRLRRSITYSSHALQPDVLEHADAADGVERLVVDRPVVLQADLDLVVQARLGHPLASEALLLLGHRDAHDLHAVVAGGMDGHRPQPQPTSSSRMPGRRPSLRQTSSCFAACASSSVRFGRRPVPAAVRPARPEDHPVEPVADVVVVRHGRRVTEQAVESTVESGLLGRRWRRRPTAPSRRAAWARSRTARGVNLSSSCSSGSASRSRMPRSERRRRRCRGRRRRGPGPGRAHRGPRAAGAAPWGSGPRR